MHRCGALLPTRRPFVPPGKLKCLAKNLVRHWKLDTYDSPCPQLFRTQFQAHVSSPEPGDGRVAAYHRIRIRDDIDGVFQLTLGLLLDLGWRVRVGVVEDGTRAINTDEIEVVWGARCYGLDPREPQQL